jgi:ribosomal subunit interface protein
MQTMITARHGDIPDDVKARAEVLVERLALRITRPTSAQVTFVIERDRAAAEIMLKAARGVTYVAKAEADDARTALDRVAAKIQRQLDKADDNPARRASRKMVS